MKAILIIILLFANSAQAQNYSKTPGSIDLIFMSKALNNVAISNDLNKISSIEIAKPLQYVGIALTSGFIVNNISASQGGYPIDGFIEYLQVIPQQIKIYDSINVKVNGFNFGLTLAGIDLIKSEKVDIITCLGFNTGRIWLNGPDQLKQKNPYFAPMIAIIPRVCIGKISIQLKCGYDYDISNKSWKRKGFSDSELLDLKKFNYQGLNFSFGIGYIFN